MKTSYVKLILILICLISYRNAIAQDSGESKDGTQIWKVVHRPKLDDFPLNKEEIENKLINIIKNHCYSVYDLVNNFDKSVNDIIIHENHIEIIYNKKTKQIVDISEILNNNISLRKNENKNPTINIINPYYIRIGNVVMFTFAPYNLEVAKEFSDLLFKYQFFTNEKHYAEQMRVFESLANEYKSLIQKPVISEEQRKFIVQANGLNELREYKKAISLYKKAIEINPITYPAAYSNIALLSEQLSNYQTAIYYMKKYLMLEPENSDARAAQDKIYMWELMLKD